MTGWRDRASRQDLYIRLAVLRSLRAEIERRCMSAKLGAEIRKSITQNAPYECTWPPCEDHLWREHLEDHAEPGSYGRHLLDAVIEVLEEMAARCAADGGDTP